MYMYVYIYRQRERECVCKLAAKPRGRQVFPDFMETSHRRVKRFGQFTMKGQQSEWLKNVESTCSLMQFAHKWIQMMQLIYCSNDLGLSKNRVSQNYPISVRFATGITPPYLDKPQAQVWRFFCWATATSSQKRKFASSPIFHPWVYTHPWATLGSWFFLRCHVTVDLDLEMKKSSQLPPEVRVSRWVSLHRFAARLAVVGAAQRFPHAKEMGMTTYLPESTMEPPDCHGAPDEHREAMTPERMERLQKCLVMHGDLASTLF